MASHPKMNRLKVGALDEQVRQLWGTKSRKAICGELGISKSTLSRIATRLGLSCQYRGKIGLYEQHGATIVEAFKSHGDLGRIADEFSVSELTVRRVLLRKGVFRPDEKHSFDYFDRRFRQQPGGNS